MSSSGAATVRSDMNSVGRSVDSVGRTTDASASRATKAGGKFNALWSKMKVAGPIAAAAGGAALLKFGASAVSSASDVQQSYGALDAVFKKNAGEVRSWADGAAKSVGLAKSEYASMAAVLGASLKNSGIKDYAGQTKKLIGLGADLAAQFGGSTSEAVEALGSMLRGETDPIEKYGVSINQSKVEAYLLAQGVQKVNGQFTTQQQQTARLALAFQQTKDAQGAFRRESGTLAHQQQVLGARFENLKATIGAKLLPVITRFLSWLNRVTSGSGKSGEKFRWLASIVGSMVVPRLAALRDGAQRIAAKIQEVTRKGQPLGDMLRKLADLARKLAPVIGRILAKQVSDTADKIVTMIDVANKVAGAIQSISDKCKSAIDWLSSLASKLSKVSVPGGLLSLLKRDAGPDGPGGSFDRFNASPTPIAFNPVMNNQFGVTVVLDGRSIRSTIAGVVRTELARGASGGVYAA